MVQDIRVRNARLISNLLGSIMSEAELREFVLRMKGHVRRLRKSAENIHKSAKLPKESADDLTSVTNPDTIIT